MNAVNDYQFETSQKDLADGILKQAVLDLRRFHGATSAVEREFYVDARRWLTSNDCSWPFSFLNVCQLLNLAPETVREDVLDDLSLGAFAFYTRRCGRGTRRFKNFLSNIFANERNGNDAQPSALAHVAH